MLKILNTQQIRELDQFTIQHEPVASIDLMERACKAFCSWFTRTVKPECRVGVVCGTGNNGGDGLGVARILSEWNYSVSVWIVRGGVKESEDFKTNLERLPKTIVKVNLTEGVDPHVFDGFDMLIDAIFGSGLTRPVEGIYKSVIDAINQSKAIRIAVDIPSGLRADSHSSGSIVMADHTVSFQLPKLAFLLSENAPFVGEWHVVDIGLSKKRIEQLNTHHFLLSRSGIIGNVKPLKKFDHKGNRGRALLIAGSYGKMGAAILAARSAFRTGIGLLTVHVPGNGYSIIQTAVPEAMASIDDSPTCFTTVPELSHYDAIGIGPGLGQDTQTVKSLGTVMERFDHPMVLDADALNLMAQNRELLAIIPRHSILTPHPKEFERLAGSWTDDFEKIERQKSFAIKNRVVVVLKGAHTSIASPDGDIYFNTTGNPGMATGGVGDVLTGVLTALLAQGYSPLEAAQLGVWLHGQAGDDAARKHGIRGLIASDITDHLADAYSHLI
jgi:NAD(P)H-hydrate epimerase